MTEPGTTAQDTLRGDILASGRDDSPERHPHRVATCYICSRLQHQEASWRTPLIG